MITIVPETPNPDDALSSSSRRRSSRRSTMFSSIASDNLLKQSFEKRDTEAASRRLRELRQKESSYRTLSQTDKVTQWLARNDTDKRVEEKSADDMSLTLAAATPPATTPATSDKKKKASTRRGRRSGFLAPRDMCEILMAKENVDSPAAPSTSKTPDASVAAPPKRRKSRMLLEAADPSLAARLTFFPSPLNLSPKRRPRPSLCLSPIRRAPSFGTTSSGGTESVRRNVGDIIERLGDSPASSSRFGSPTANTEARERVNVDGAAATQFSSSSAGSIPPPNSFQNFSTDSAKAMVKQLVALSQKKELQDASNSLQDNGSGEQTSKSSDGDMSGPHSCANPILASVFAYVEVRTSHENRSRCVQDQLTALGAKVSERLTKQVTHVIFKDGSLGTYNRAKRLGAHIVSVTWIEACKKEGARVDEALFPTVSKERYDSPGLFPKLRKAKSMQPKDDAEMARQLELAQKRRKRRMEKEQTRNVTTGTASGDSPAAGASERRKPARPVPLDYYNSPKLEALRLKRLQEKKEYATNLMKLIDEVEQGNSDEVAVSEHPRVADDSDAVHNSSLNSEDFNTPLAERLVNKFRKERRRKPRGNGLADDTVASESEISVRVVETDENDISGVESIQTARTVPSPIQENLPLKRRLIITDKIGNSDGDSDDSISSGRQKPEEEKTQKEAHSVDEVPSKNPRRESKTKKPSHTTKVKPRRNRNRPLFSQKPAELLSETPADDSHARIPVPIVNVHADKAKDKAKQKPCKRNKKVSVVPENPQTEESKEVLRPSQHATQRRRIVPPRRSTLDFVDEKKKTKKKRKDNKKKKRSDEAATFVCTSCRKEDVDLMKQLASRFGSLKPATVVTPSTSHVVCGESRRTLSVLQGILRGCWIVSVEWVFASLEEGRWADEEAFERTDFSAAVRECRLGRQAFGPGLYRSRLLEDAGAIYVDRRGCKAPADQVRRLCELAGGATVKLARLADVVIGGDVSEGALAEGALAVSDTWLFDSIQQNKSLDLDRYLLRPKS